MKKIWNPGNLILGVVVTLLLGGCGGGGTAKINNGSSSGGPAPTIEQGHFPYRNISIAGSSITHGNGIGDAGYLGEMSYVGYVENYFRENIADTIGPDQLSNADSTIDDPMSYQGKIKVYGAGTEISGQLKASDEIAIVYAGSDEETKVRMEVDGQTFDYTLPTGDYKVVKKSFDDTGVDFYKAFRENNPKAVKIWKVDNKPHTFTLTVLSGSLHLNFITNHMYFFQNAGVSGYEASDFLRESPSGGYARSTVKEIIDFDPDIFIFESCTNDAKTWSKELQLKANSSIDNPSTNDWRVEDPVPFTSNAKQITLNGNVTVKKGDVVIMGEYNGDIQNMAVGIVAADSTGPTVTLSKIVSYAGQKVTEVDAVPSDIVKQCRIKSIALWEGRVKQVVDAVKQGVGHELFVGIGTSGVPNYYDPRVHAEYEGKSRRLLGYREKGKMMAQENGWAFVDFFANILKVNPRVDADTKTWSIGDNTHPNANGWNYFGDAVVKALLGQ